MYGASDSRQCKRDQAGCGSKDCCGFGYVGNLSQQAVCLIVDAGGKIYGVRVETGSGAGLERPEEGIDDRLAICSVKDAQECVGRWVIGEDLAVAEVADQQIVAEETKAGGSQSNSPRRGERATACDSRYK